MTKEEFNGYLKKIKYDKKSLDRVYSYFYPRIIMHIKRKYPMVQAEDIAQEFFLNLMNYDNQNFIYNPISWVYTSCDNLIRKNHNKEFEIIELEKCNIVHHEFVLENLIINEKMEEIFKKIKDDDTKKILYLYYWEGYNLKEIAVLLNKNKSTIKQKHYRAIKLLKKELN